MKLLVYIPTYNRAKSLLKQLETLKLYNSGKDILEVIVSDNCSTQGEYKDSIENFCKDSKFNYNRRICNLGPNPNILDGFLHCETADYLWILSDDDLIKPNAIDRIFEFLHKYPKSDLLHLIVGDTKGQLRPFDQADLLRNLNNLGLISSCVYRTEFIRPYIFAGYENLLSCFQHLAIIFEAVKQTGAITVCQVSEVDYFYAQNTEERSEHTRNHSFYGFPLLSTNMLDNIAKEFLWSWWKMHSVKAIRNADLAPMHSAACFAMMKKYIPVRFFLSKFFPRNLFAILHLPLHKLDRKQIKLFQFKRDK
jgi:glycosyltransferase involved in cell wall biosynthesis